jgi:hypothetical protein
MSALNRAFESLATHFLSRHPEIPHEWRRVKDPVWGERTDLVCGIGTPNEVYASLLGYQIAVGATSGDHHDFEDYGRGLSDSDVAKQAFDRLTELLRLQGHL